MTATWAEQDLERREREQEEWMRTRPVCELCGEPIQEEIYYEPEPGFKYCPDCFGEYIRGNFMHYIE